MKKLSSRWTFFYKRIFPAIWFSFLAPVVFVPLLVTKGDWFLAGAVLLFASVMALFGYHFFKHTCFDLIDSVLDDGATLVFRNGAQEARVPLRDIKNISYTVVMNPPRVTVTSRHDTPFGRELTFSPPAGLVPFRKSKDIETLIDRIDAARRANQAL